MKQFAIIIGIIFKIHFIHATDYYVSNTGNDQHTGTGESQAWASIHKLNQVIPALRSGDRVFFQRGSRFEGILEIKNIIGSDNNPIVFGAYGSGEDPVIDGTMEVRGWTKEGNIWTAKCRDCPNEIYTLFINDKSQPLSRYPNDSFLVASGGSGKILIYDSDLSFDDNYWNGAQVVISTQSWVRDALRVLSQIGTKITLSGSTSYEITGEKQYFFQNHYNALDSEGEWAYNSTDQELYIFSTMDLQNASVRVSHQAECISVRNSRYVNIENLTLRGSRLYSLRIDYSGHIRFDGNAINSSGRTAVHIDHGEHIEIENNSIMNSLDLGIGVWDTQNCRIAGNRVENTGMIPGRGRNGVAHYNGIIVNRGSGNVIEYNEVSRTGYCGITFYNQTDLLIKNNYINDFGRINTDGGGIYTWHHTSPGIRITGNIVMTSEIDFGIYIDDNSSNIEVDSNTIAFCRAGIFIHNSDLIKISNNTCFDNTQAQLLFVHRRGFPIDHCEIRNNHFFSLGKNPKNRSMTARYVAGENNVFENNCFADPYRDELIYSNSSALWGTGFLTVAQWQSLGYITDRAIPFTFAESGLSDTTGFVKFFINPSKSKKTVNIPGTYRDLDNQVYVGSVQLDAYTSVILLAEELEVRDKIRGSNGAPGYYQGSFLGTKILVRLRGPRSHNPFPLPPAYNHMSR